MRENTDFVTLIALATAAIILLQASAKTRDQAALMRYQLSQEQQAVAHCQARPK